VGDFNYWAVEAPPLELERLDTGLRILRLRLPSDAYIEYAYLESGKRLPDPLNRRVVGDGMGHINSYVWMPDAIDTPPSIKVWLDVGQHEWFLEPNRQMHGLLKDRRYDVTYVEHTSGHNYPSWRNVLWRGLEHLYAAGSGILRESGNEALRKA
jgi:hypothetical protein